MPEFGLVPRDEDEGLFSRNINGQLVRLDTPTVADYDTTVNIQIDGIAVEMPVAEPLRDAQGNILLNLDGRTTPRYTTIFDAIVKLDKSASTPTLCHQSHMTPVAVCRICVVQVYGQRNGQRTPERKLLPACQHQVKAGMEVLTMEAPGPDGDRVRRVTRVLAELLVTDHLKPAPAPAPAPADDIAPFNELRLLAERCNLSQSLFLDPAFSTSPQPVPPPEAPAGRRQLDSSSPVFLVDHSACILCDRCIRACDEVKNNQVIGRTGKGSSTGIAFDLNDTMLASSCVQCGECMVSCPTSAITFKPVGEVKSRDSAANEVVSLAELTKDPLFAGVPAKFLLWQKGLVRRRRLHPGEVLFREGDPGHSAFIMKQGRLLITPPGAQPISRGVEDVIVGEMACLSGSPRSADVSAVDECELWEVRRNVLDRMMRSPNQRGVFERLYRERALSTSLRTSELFLNLPADEYERSIEFLRPQLEFVRVNPGQTIFRQGDLAADLYFIRLGHVRIAISRHGGDATIVYRGPGSLIGEISLLAVSKEQVGMAAEDVYGDLLGTLNDAQRRSFSDVLPAGRRTATCSALDHLELARVRRAAFLGLIQQFPTIGLNVVRLALNRLKEDL